MFIISNVSFFYGKNLIIFLQNISNTQGDSGFICFLQGKNGSGKTTLLNMLWNESLDYSGKHSMNGICNGTGGVHLIPSELEYGDRDTVYDFIKYCCSLEGSGSFLSESFINMILEEFLLMEMKNTKIINLSLGQKKRLHLFKLKYFYKKYWILDEPFLGLDFFWKQFLESLIWKHRISGGIVFVSSHSNLMLKANLYVYI